MYGQSFKFIKRGLTMKGQRILGEPPKAYGSGVRVPHVQCEAGIPEDFSSPTPRKERMYNRKREQYRKFEPYQCQRRAIVSLDGHRLCSLHAGQVALAEILGEPCPVTFGPLRPD